MTTPEVYGQQKQQTRASNFGQRRFEILQLIGKLCTFDVVEVIECTNAGELAEAGRVVIRVLTNQVDGNDQAMPHLPIYDIPYMRIQGGATAFIIDPAPGDIGIAAFARRDISGVKAAKGEANPGSRRMFDWADAVYLGGLLNAQPTQYVRASEDGLELVSPSRVRIQAPTVEIVGTLEQSDGDASFAQSVDVGDSLTAATEVTAGNIGLTTHKHPTAPTGPPSAPIP